MKSSNMKYNEYELKVKELSTRISPIKEDMFFDIYEKVEDSAYDMLCWNYSYGLRERFSDDMYVSIADNFEGNQVFRTFQLRFRIRSSGSFPQFSFCEIGQEWHDKNGNVATLRKAYHRRERDVWNFKSAFRLSREKVNPFLSHNCYVDSQSIFIKNLDYSYRDIIKAYYNEGYDVDNCGTDECNKYYKLAMSEAGEFLYKCGYKDLFDTLSNGNSYMIDSLEKYFYAVKIAHRHKYNFAKDFSLWIDTLNYIEKCNGDTHNPKFICTADLVEEHNKWYELYIKNREKFEIIRKMKEAAKHDEEYRKRMERFLDIAFTSSINNYKFTVIQSASEMAEEGAAMHHCVGGYWNRVDSLILSCKDMNGKRVATIEVDLKSFKIVQTRAACNKVPDNLEEINYTINLNMDIIKNAKSIKLAA